MWTTILDIGTLSTMCIGLGLSLLTILHFHDATQLKEWYFVPVIIFLPLLYSLLSVSKLVFGYVCLYFLLAILVYHYMNRKFGRLYFLLSVGVIIGYLSIVERQISMSLVLLICVNGILVYLATMAVDHFNISKLLKTALSAIVMLGLERLSGYFVPRHTPFTFKATMISAIALLIVLAVIHYFYVYLTKRQAMTDELTHKANVDELTELYNLYHLHQDFSLEQINKTMLFIAVIDLDHFKQVNDTYGHTMGNKVLKVFAEQIHQYFIRELGKNNFTLYRYGGEEFVVAIKQLKDTPIRELFAQLQVEINQINIDDLVEQLSFSAGVACLKAYHHDPLKAFEAADRLLYAAKKAGRHQTIVEQIC